MKNYLGFVAEGYLFVVMANVEYDIQTLGSFELGKDCVNVIVTSSKNEDELKRLTKELKDEVPSDLSDEIIYAAKKQAYVCDTKQPVKLPINVKIVDDTEFRFEWSGKELTIFGPNTGEVLYFYYPCPDDVFSEHVDN